MVPSSALTITTNGECFSCDGFSIGETIRSGSLEFIVDRFGSLSLSPTGDNSGAIAMGLAYGRP
jgi:hypothetical protein